MNLKTQLQGLGFGNVLPELYEKLATKKASFQIMHSLENANDAVYYVLNFAREGKQDYVFSSYYALLCNNDENIDREQLFPLNRGLDFSANEAYNLLDGRSVCKQIDTEDRQLSPWFRLRFNHLNEEGYYRVEKIQDSTLFDLEKELSRLAIKELRAPGQKEMLIRSLREGDRPPVHFEHKGNELKLSIHIRPEHHLIELRDHHGQLHHAHNLLHILSSINTIIMNEKNLEFISKQLKESGFGETLNNELKEKIERQIPEFTLIHQSDFGNDRLTAALQFRKSAESDMYFFNRVEMSIKNENQAESRKQSFYANNNITPKDGYNLIQGRAVYKEMTGKEGNKYNAWLQLNFKETDQYGNFTLKQFHDNYGFDLKATLEKYQVKELPSSENSLSLIESLKNGNREAVTIVKDGSAQKLFIEASPRFKSLNLYDADMKRVNLKDLSEKKSENQSQGQAKKQSAKQSAGDAEDGMHKGEKRNKRQRQTLS
jgi:hypothetical protein